MKIKTSKFSRSFFEFAIAFMLLQQALFPSEMTLESLLFVIIAGGIVAFQNKLLVNINPFLQSYGAFLYVVLLGILFGFGEENTARSFLLLAGGYLASISLYIYLREFHAIERFIHIYLAVSCVAMIAILLLLQERVFSSRMGHNGSGAIVSYYLLSHPIYKSSNSTANISAICVFFCLFRYSKTKKIGFAVLAAFFTGICLLCGSRKGTLCLVVYLLYCSFFLTRGVNPKKILLFLSFPILGYVLLFKNPVLYAMIGKRIESLLLNIMGYTNTMDGASYVERRRLQTLAWQWIVEKPLFGYGNNTFSDSAGNGVENNFLSLWVNFGLVGLISYYSFIPLFFRKIIRSITKKTLASVMSVIILCVLVQDVGSVSYLWPHITMWYSICWAAMLEEDSVKAKDNTQVTQIEKNERNDS